ncbi:MAG: RIP metalloprotease RseP [Candidatus Magasanikbacteria bacterium RIFCSPHIGHO2_02_FULL_47_14]|uniref:Zinc metalloprotease n=1 Tax=Candidatus Magasanikbacteria bacterium RIFCSPHIGHO2_02_FULL_47_14 TaxID=1798680 RepID=A0A1F6M3Z7_9BACT|nr:MAG: RIP metalloprotease RseP [Candidatus Magasanikbacteria bacterium RIFCSPHIGHO2_02_FULL_47_14]
MVTALLFILVLSVLVVVHEFGHFITARKSGMRVYEFGLGFPPRACGIYKDPKTKKWVFVRVSKKNRDKKTQSNLANIVGGEEKEEEYPATLYSLNWLPIGGFVKIKGENGEATNESDSFGFQKTWKKSIVLVAGVTMNFLLAAVLLGFGFLIGLPAEISDRIGKDAIIVEPARVLVQQLENDSPAQQAGIQFGDVIVSINNVAITSTEQMISYVREHNTEQLAVVIEREKQQQTLSLTPTVVKEGEPARLGIVLAEAGVVRYPWYTAFFRGFYAAGISLVNIFISFYFLIKGLIVGQGLAFDVAGPVGIASIVGQSAALGIHYFINVAAMISLSLAAVNILPIPALDGGRLLFIIIEKIFRRPVPLKYEQAAHTIGFVLLLILIVVVTFRDIVHLF